MHTTRLALGMIEQSVALSPVKAFLGHPSLEMTERSVKVYLKSLRTTYDAYCTAQEPLLKYARWQSSALGPRGHGFPCCASPRFLSPPDSVLI